MNKYIIIAIVAVVLLGGGIAYKIFLKPSTAAECSGGATREFTVTAKKDAWAFEPDTLEVNCGDKVIMKVINEDNYDHGIGIDAFGVTQRLPANETVTVQFTASKAGDWPFYCSVPCGEGEVDHHKRGHFDMVGTLHVTSHK